MRIEVLKYELFTQIAQIQNEALLQKLKAVLDSLSQEQDLFYRVVKPMRRTLTVETLIQEQNYKGFDRKGFDELAQRLDLQTPFEELLKSL